MTLTASQLLEQRMTKDKQDMETSFQHEVSIANRRFGPVSQNPNIETARIRALTGLRQKYQAKADKLISDYEERTRSWEEIDTMAAQGQLGVTNPEELKMRSVMPPEVEKAMFPKPEEGEDPVAEYGKLSTQLERVEKALGRFEAEAPSSIRTHRRGVGRLAPFPFASRKVEVPGGGTLVTSEEYDPTADKGKGKVVKVRRRATREELEEWASLTEHQRQLREAIAGIRKSEPMAARLRLAAVRSPRMGNAGAFAEQATGISSQEKTTLDFGKMSDEELKRLAGVE
jgi:hypothetical protein